MKKQISLFAIAAASIAMAAPHAHAQEPAVPFTPTGPGVDSGGTANVITVSGTIEESIIFTKVDNQLELGNIGGAGASGIINSVSGRRSGASGTENFTGTAPANAAGNGYAEIEFTANTDVKVTFAGDDVKGGSSGVVAGTPNGQNRTSPYAQQNANHVLPTAYRVSTKGKVTFSDGYYQNAPASGGTGQNPTNPGPYSAYTPGPFEAGTTTAPNNLAAMELIFGAGGPSGTGAQGGTATPNASGPNAPSGFLVMAEITRNGTNDPAGLYTGALNLNYFKF